VSQLVEAVIKNRIASRIAAKDFTIWGRRAEAEATNRLGWVSSAGDSAELVGELVDLRKEFLVSGIDRFVLCGMGGSSLAPEVIAKSQGSALIVVDTTAPEQVLLAMRELERTAVIVSSKSGSTIETDSQKRVFESAFESAGIDASGRIVVVTDPGSPLEDSARQSGYRIFSADPTVGGRYSALTAFGLVPSALAGCDVSALLQSAENISPLLIQDSAENPAIGLAVAIAGRKGVDKFLIETESTPGFGDWVEQLVAESTGKDGLGVLPVVVESSAPEWNAGLTDVTRVSNSDESADVVLQGDLGELFLTWEYATAIAGWLLAVNPLDQPNVESAKLAARMLLDAPGDCRKIDFVNRGVAIRGYGLNLSGATIESAIEELFLQVGERSYLAIQAYLPALMYPQFQKLRQLSALRLLRPVTYGWGPRFLHSTGQYHKGGPKRGVFLQLTYQPQSELAIPGRPFGFAELIAAQASGDARVLAEAGLPVLSLELADPLAGLELIVQSIER
jgi:glucose-6-phosphate isomerase